MSTFHNDFPISWLSSTFRNRVQVRRGFYHFKSRRGETFGRTKEEKGVFGGPCRGICLKICSEISHLDASHVGSAAQGCFSMGGRGGGVVSRGFSMELYWTVPFPPIHFLFDFSKASESLSTELLGGFLRFPVVVSYGGFVVSSPALTSTFMSCDLGS